MIPLTVEAIVKFKPSDRVQSALYYALGQMANAQGAQVFLELLEKPPTGIPLNGTEHRQFRRILDWLFEQLTTEESA